MNIFSTLFICCFIALQLYIPASYYYKLLFQKEANTKTEDKLSKLDLYDERFVWRMFSSQSLTKSCSVRFYKKEKEGNFKEILIERYIFIGWKDLIKLCRRQVIEEVTNYLCEKEGVEEIYRTTLLLKRGQLLEEIEEERKIYCKK